MKNKQGRVNHLLFQRNGFRSRKLNKAEREQGKDIQLGTRIETLKAMHKPGDVVKVGKSTYVVARDFSLRKLPHES